MQREPQSADTSEMDLPFSSVVVPPRALAELLMKMCGVEPPGDATVLRVELCLEGGVATVAVTRWLRAAVPGPAAGMAQALLQRCEYALTATGKPEEWNVSAAGEVTPRWGEVSARGRRGARE